MYEYWDHIQNKVLVVFFLTIYSQLIKKKKELPVRLQSFFTSISNFEN